jgi:hypothetical protein
MHDPVGDFDCIRHNTILYLTRHSRNQKRGTLAQR